MKFKARFGMPRLDLTGYRREVEDTLTEAVQDGAERWLEAALSRVPVWSAASHATFLKLASAIRYTLPIEPAAVDRRHIGQSRSEGGLDIDARKGRYTFFYTTSLAWLIWNEYHNANVTPDPTLIHRLRDPGPYRFQMAAQEAFQRFAQSVRLPRVSLHLRGIRHGR